LRDRTTDPIDKHVGQRLRERRTRLGLSQSAVGKELGITFQQLQKNEWGINRIGASRLYALSKILAVPVEYFFENMPAPARKLGRQAGRPEDTGARPAADDAETLRLVRAFYRIDDPKLRSKLMELCRALGDEEK